VDDQKLQQAISLLLEALGEDPTRAELAHTPTRVAELFRDLYRGVGVDPASVLESSSALVDDNDHVGDLVWLRGIQFSSICEHHLLPFRGSADVAYQPRERLVGLGVLAELVSIAAARPQMQERLGDMVADALVRSGVASGALVLIRAEHGCVQHRGPRLHEAETVTMASAGTLQDPGARREALQTIGQQG